jgi:hypothetical protein
MSGDVEQECFADGIAEDIITASLPGVKERQNVFDDQKACQVNDGPDSHQRERYPYRQGHRFPWLLQLHCFPLNPARLSNPGPWKGASAARSQGRFVLMVPRLEPQPMLESMIARAR